jgi:hypothetical protein
MSVISRCLGFGSQDLLTKQLLSYRAIIYWLRSPTAPSFQLAIRQASDVSRPITNGLLSATPTAAPTDKLFFSYGRHIIKLAGLMS